MHGLKKMLRDLWRGRGRAAFMVFAMAVGLSGLGAVLGAYGVLTREIRRNYMDTVPASVTFDMQRVSPELLEAVRKRPEVAAADRRRTIHARFRRRPEEPWARAFLFEVDDFANMPLAKLRPERGAWPPPVGTLLVERSALAIVGVDIGGTVSIQTPHGEPHQLAVSGVVHDPALAPASTEQAAYLYLSAETLASLGEAPQFDELRVLMAHDAGDRSAIERDSQRIGRWLESRGHAVRRIEIPPPARHPHEGQMQAVLTMLAIFAALVVVLSSVLTATLMSTLMARQVREIGVMKTLGARSRQIGWLYLVMVATLAVIALGLAWWPSVLGAHSWATAAAGLLNFDVASYAIPSWVSGTLAGVGVGVPLLVATPVIWRGSRITVREAIADYGVDADAFGKRRLDRLLARQGGRLRLVWLAVRNALRRRGRFALAFGLLAVGGAMFVSAVSVSRAYGIAIERVSATRHYDVEIRLERPASSSSAIEKLRALPQVRAVEPWGFSTTSFTEPNTIDVASVYPDDGHGAFHVLAPPASTSMIDIDLIEGRWLEPGDDGVVVFNQMVLGLNDFGDDGAIGKTVHLRIGDRAVPLRVVGIVEEVATPAVAYVTPATFDRAMGLGGRATMFRVAASSDDDAAATLEAIPVIEQTLEQQGAGIATTLPLQVLKNAFAEHITLLIASLLALAVLMAIVGALGLSSALSTNVVERTREIGILKAIGAGASRIKRMVAYEGLFVAISSLGAAVLLAVPLALIIGEVVGQMSFRLSLPFALSWWATGAWALGVIALSLLATTLPARQAAKLTVHDALAYV